MVPTGSLQVLLGNDDHIANQLELHLHDSNKHQAGSEAKAQVPQVNPALQTESLSLPQCMESLFM